MKGFVICGETVGTDVHDYRSFKNIRCGVAGRGALSWRTRGWQLCDFEASLERANPKLYLLQVCSLEGPSHHVLRSCNVWWDLDSRSWQSVKQTIGGLHFHGPCLPNCITPLLFHHQRSSNNDP